MARFKSGPLYRLARKRYPKADISQREGRYALLSCTFRGLVISLYSERLEAWKARNRLDATGCGGFCSHRHSVIDLLAD